MWGDKWDNNTEHHFWGAREAAYTKPEASKQDASAHFRTLGPLSDRVSVASLNLPYSQGPAGMEACVKVATFTLIVAG